MGQINLPSLDDITQIKDPKQQMEALLNTVGILMKSLSEINGYLNSKNIFEAGGWRVTDTELVSKDGDVGMSTEDTAADDARFWAGGIDKDTAPWRVLESGKMFATGATIQSASGYPKVIMNPTELLGAYLDANNHISIVPDYSSLPAILFYRTGALIGRVWSSTTSKFNITSENDLDLYASGHLSLDAFGGVSVGSFARFYSDSGTYAGQNLASALNNKATAGAATNTNGAHNHGIPDGTVLSVSGGGTVTWVSAAGHAHNQT